MKIYLYDRITGAFIAESPADESPAEPGVLLIPNNATTLAPPGAGANETAVFADGAWTIVPDFRGQIVYDTVTGETDVWHDLGPLPVTKTIQARPNANYDWNGSEWTFNIARARSVAMLLIDQEAGSTRMKYVTSVPGQPETYLEKAADASAYKAAGYPSASIASYPWVLAEANAIYGSAPTPAQYQTAADGILMQKAEWTTKGTQIEQQRRAGKIAAGAATAEADVNAARESAIRTLQSL